MTFLYYAAIFAFMLLALFLCGVILVQESKSSGLGASFGGEASESLFGTATADVLKKFTGWLALVFLVSCLLLSFWTASLGRAKSQVDPALVEQVDEAD